MLLTGLAMSPGGGFFAPWPLEIFGGRQGARLIHFLTTNVLVLLLFIHPRSYLRAPGTSFAR
jgi:thiosulfate reductase cytochrome b subunit